MKVAGRFELYQLARIDPSVCETLRAFHAELEAARWRNEVDVRAAFPDADFEDGRLVLALDETRCVVVAFSYPQEIAVIEYAGARAERPSEASKLRRARP